ncbi:MAG: putative lipid II flippase FtsW [Desulfuromonadales bacterium]|nr:putative lipid II flippase FtsW [Desulfuromonadales bacterium]NIS41223.1 putative lipid II flippase FtsW [Desulfuromonadales bacterium]
MVLRREFDPSILLLAVGLTCFGVVMVYSSSSIMAAKRFDDGFFFLKRQGIYAMAGFALMAIFSQVDYRRLRALAVPALLGCGLLLIAVLIPGIGKAAGGATRWIHLAGVSIQPGELAKLALVLYMAHSLAKKKSRITDFKFGFLPYMIVLALLLGLLLKQPDLGTAVSLAAIAMVMLLVAGTRLTYLSSVAVLALPFLYFAIMNVEYRRKRLLAFINPWDDPSDTGFQIIQSWLAFGAGGWFGKGLGEGKQKLFYLPEAHTDFIFSVVGEELGFLGVLTVTIMFFVLVWRGLKVALEAQDDFGCYLAFGLSLLLGFGAVVNLGVALGLLPTKGLTLPFISYGGTSLLTTLAAVGILLNISAQTQGGTR